METTVKVKALNININISSLNHIWSPPKQDKRNNEEGGIRIEGEDRAGGGGEQLGVEGGAGHLQDH